MPSSRSTSPMIVALSRVNAVDLEFLNIPALHSKLPFIVAPCSLTAPCAENLLFKNTSAFMSAFSAINATPFLLLIFVASSCNCPCNTIPEMFTDPFIEQIFSTRLPCMIVPCALIPFKLQVMKAIENGNSVLSRLIVISKSALTIAIPVRCTKCFASGQVQSHSINLARIGAQN